jgi:hypothetical protein
MAKMKMKDGTKLTRKKLRELAAEAEAGYDLSTATWEPNPYYRPGRPSLDEGVSPQISYRIPATLFEKARARARAEGRTVSEIAREALQRYLG